MKVAPLLPALRAGGHDAYLCHTGQHYDSLMSKSFFDDLGIQEPDVHLAAGGGTHAQQLAKIMRGVEPEIAKVRPDWVIVVGDVNSTLGSALVAARLRSSIGCRIAHVEAGLRSYDWRMPEEINRVLTDRIANLLLTPSRDATNNLVAEGIEPAKIAFVGNIMIDSVFAHLPRARSMNIAKKRKLPRRGFAIATLHRPSNVDDPKTFAAILSGIELVSTVMPVIFPTHPRSTERLLEFSKTALSRGIHVVDPLGYLEMLSLTESAAVVITDSGGLQEETTVLGVPCVTVREQTERPVTISEGTNRLVDWPPSPQRIAEQVTNAVDSADYEPRLPEGWDGNAAGRILAALEAARTLIAPQGSKSRRS